LRKAGQAEETALDQLSPLVHRFAASIMELAVMLVPLTVYLLLLGLGVNRARRPTVVAGPWSFALLLLGLSGLLFLGPPSWIAHLLRPRGEYAYWLAYGIYFLGVLLLSLSLCMRQRRTLVVYNIDPEQFSAVLQEVLANLQLEFAHTPGRVSIEKGKLLMDIEVSYLWQNACLNWQGHEGDTRGRVESTLRQALKSVESGANPASLLLTLLAVVIVSFQVLAITVFVLFVR
jgi:hypothetical protein